MHLNVSGMKIYFSVDLNRGHPAERSRADPDVLGLFCMGTPSPPSVRNGEQNFSLCLVSLQAESSV